MKSIPLSVGLHAQCLDNHRLELVLLKGQKYHCVGINEATGNIKVIGETGAVIEVSAKAFSPNAFNRKQGFFFKNDLVMVYNSDFFGENIAGGLALIKSSNYNNPEGNYVKVNWVKNDRTIMSSTAGHPSRSERQYDARAFKIATPESCGRYLNLLASAKPTVVVESGRPTVILGGISPAILTAR